MEYLMYVLAIVLAIVVIGLVLHDWFTLREKDGLEPYVEKEVKPQVVTFPDGEVLTIPDGWKFYEVPDISDWTPPMKEIFSLITKDRKSWIKTDVDGEIRHTHKVFGYSIFKKVLVNITCSGTYEQFARTMLNSKEVLTWYEETLVVRLAEIYFKVKYHERVFRLERLKQHKAKKLKTERDQKQLLIRQQEADKINEYLATLKKGVNNANTSTIRTVDCNTYV
jgi:hypothetical protein